VGTKTTKKAAHSPEMRAITTLFDSGAINQPGADNRLIRHGFRLPEAQSILWDDVRAAITKATGAL
jgi:hypothetical protein